MTICPHLEPTRLCDMEVPCLGSKPLEHPSTANDWLMMVDDIAGRSINTFTQCLTQPAAGAMPAKAGTRPEGLSGHTWPFFSLSGYTAAAYCHPGHAFSNSFCLCSLGNRVRHAVDRGSLVVPMDRPANYTHRSQPCFPSTESVIRLGHVFSPRIVHLFILSPPFTPKGL